jgi:hypothetical protein
LWDVQVVTLGTALFAQKGSVANNHRGDEGSLVCVEDLRSDAEEGMNKPALPDHIAFRQPSDLLWFS